MKKCQMIISFLCTLVIAFIFVKEASLLPKSVSALSPIKCDEYQEINQPPSMNVTASPSDVQPGEQSVLTAIANDPEEDRLTYTWSAVRGQVPSGAISDNVVIYIAPDTPGSDSIHVIVNDGYNLVDGWVVVRVVPPPPPPSEGEGGGAGSPPSGTTGKIAFPVFDNECETYDIYIANPDGSSRYLAREEASQPDINPDGSKLAFRSWQGNGRGLWIMNVDRTEPRRITEHFSLEDARPSWSLNSLILVYFSRSEGDHLPRLWQVGQEGSDEHKLQCIDQPIFGEGPDWMPDGRIVYKKCDITSNCFGIHISNIDGSGEMRLTYDPSDTNPAPSLEGDRIAFMSCVDDNWEVYIVNTDGSGLRNLTQNPTNDGLPTWSPDGGSIAFVSDRDGGWGIWVMNVDGSNQRKLFDISGQIDGYPVREWYSARGWIEERISWGP